MIAHRDFVPRVLAKARWFRPAAYETFEATLAAANAWIEAEAVRVVNVETVLLPEMHRPPEKRTSDAEFAAVGTWVRWSQVIRVWYEK
jgi:hypothetical protein